MSSGRILVTGATGFIGRNLVSRLRSSHPLTVAVRKSEEADKLWRGQGDIRIVATGPIETSTSLEDAFSGVSAVVHLAGLAHVEARGADTSPFMRANADATEKLVEMSARLGVRSFIHLSSLAAVVGNASAEVVNDDTRHPAPTPYGISKRLAEDHVERLPEMGLFSVSLRPPLVVGAEARGNWHALQRLAASGLPLPFGSVRNRRSLVSVGSVVEAISHLCSRPWPTESAGNYCLADGDTLSLPEIVTLLRRGMEIPPRLIPFPPAVLSAAARAVKQDRRAAGLLGDLEVDESRFQETFGFTASEGIREAIVASGQMYKQVRESEPR
ncbi:NAD-dependent epimerase/dehydratase family protein [Hyphomicrobium sp.]|uniref:NAD-dependent epimerase/dehydratase family protein n=1 Tax=Hyphomicrobium sp. TaxID=82 RepID=UPI002E3381DB|nr:NAD-dependent epimerase/dehydratase family protein [Hyphomicrobium sp.]HEX2839812.1 NAD-dependent epimerase/dehydratase family protein [Hyphomicrobium sp.]